MKMSQTLRYEIECALHMLMIQSPGDCQTKLEQILGYKLDENWDPAIGEDEGRENER